MALMHVEFFAESLGMSSSIDVIIPQRRKPAGGGDPAFRPPYPVLYLLHGASDNHTSWQRHTGIERYASELGLAVVMPAINFSFYADQKNGLDYFTYLSEELPQIVDEFFHVSNDREDRFAAGLSMGGYGAFKLGIVCPDKYAAVASLSGSLTQRERIASNPPGISESMKRMARSTFGSPEEYDRSVNDLAWMLEQRLAEGAKLPAFYQACGTIDNNFRMNTDFHGQFQGRIDLTYEETPGRGHEWSYWDEYIQKVLAWLPLRKAPLG